MPKEGFPDIGRDIFVLTGTSQAHRATIAKLSIPYKTYETPLLDELRGGDYHGMSRDEIRVRQSLQCRKWAVLGCDTYTMLCNICN